MDLDVVMDTLKDVLSRPGRESRETRGGTRCDLRGKRSINNQRRKTSVLQPKRKIVLLYVGYGRSYKLAAFHFFSPGKSVV